MMKILDHKVTNMANNLPRGGFRKFTPISAPAFPATQHETRTALPAYQETFRLN